jgi:hypothetical protein
MSRRPGSLAVSRMEGPGPGVEPGKGALCVKFYVSLRVSIVREIASRSTTWAPDSALLKASCPVDARCGPCPTGQGTQRNDPDQRTVTAGRWRRCRALRAAEGTVGSPEPQEPPTDGSGALLRVQDAALLIRLSTAATEAAMPRDEPGAGRETEVRFSACGSSADGRSTA